METAYKWPEGEKIVYIRPPHEVYEGKLGNFYDPKCFPELQIIRDNWEGIRDEIFEYENRNGLLRGVSSYTPPENTENLWTNLYLMNYLWKFHKNRKKLPFTTSLIEQIPNCTYATVSILPGMTDIYPHFGDTNVIMRSHIGLLIPKPYPTIAIKVGQDEVGWEDGGMICFPISNEHSVWNRSSERRYILIVDIVPEIHKHMRFAICSRALGNQSFIFFYKKFKFVQEFPNFVHEVMISIATLMWRIYLPIQRNLKFL